MSDKILLSQPYENSNGRTGRDFYAGYIGFGRVENVSNESRGWPTAPRDEVRRTVLVSFIDFQEHDSEVINYSGYSIKEVMNSDVLTRRLIILGIKKALN